MISRDVMNINWRKGSMGVESVAQGWLTRPGDLENHFRDSTPEADVSVIFWMDDPAEFLAQQAINSSFHFKDLSEAEIRVAANNFIENFLD